MIYENILFRVIPKYAGTMAPMASASIVNICNSLPNSVVDVDTVCLFKARLDGHPQ